MLRKKDNTLKKTILLMNAHEGNSKFVFPRVSMSRDEIKRNIEISALLYGYQKNTRNNRPYFTQQVYFTKENSFVLITFTIQKALLEAFDSISSCFLCMLFFFSTLHSFNKFGKRSTLGIISRRHFVFLRGQQFFTCCPAGYIAFIYSHAIWNQPTTFSVSAS